MATVRPARVSWIDRADADNGRWVYFEVSASLAFEDLPGVWTVSGAVDGYYYTGAEFPAKPGALTIDGALADEGATAALLEGEWGWGDEDALGTDTIYIRLTGDADPDAALPGTIRAFTYALADAAVYDRDELMVGTRVGPAAPESRQERYRSIIRFAQPTAPDWTTDGPIALRGGLLKVMLGSGTQAASPVVEIAVVTNAWTDASTALELYALGVGVWRETTRLDKVEQSTQALWIASLPAVADHGYVLRDFGTVGSGDKMLRLTTTPPPVIEHVYQYTVTDAPRLDATERSAVPAAVLAVVEDRGTYQRFRTRTTVRIQERDPAEEDIDLTSVAGQPAVISRRLTWPESWLPDIPAAGGLPLSLVSDGGMIGGANG